MSRWTDVSTIIAAAAALWGLALAWLTYVMSVRQKNQDEFLALKSIATGLRVDLELMRDWTGAGGLGYSKNMTTAQAPTDWSLPGRMIWKFGFEAFPKLLSSPYLYRVRDIVEPFARLSFSISRLFQLYDEYRTFVNSDPAVFSLGATPATYTAAIFQFNFDMHVRLIGGADSDDPACLYKCYEAANSALGIFENGLRSTALPRWFWIGHLASLAVFLSGVFLLVRLFCP
jgi:hypothetical protein